MNFSDDLRDHISAHTPIACAVRRRHRAGNSATQATDLFAPGRRRRGRGDRRGPRSADHDGRHPDRARHHWTPWTCCVRRGVQLPTPTEIASPGTPTTAPHFGKGATGKVPNLILQLADREVALRAWTACWGNGCYDGSPDLIGGLEDVGSPNQVIAWSPVADMEWEVTFRELPPRSETGSSVKRRVLECARSISYSAKPYDGHHVTLEPAGLAGRYEVSVFGRAPSGGDVVYSFDWTTPANGVAPAPAGGVAAVLANHDGALDSYGVEVSISNLGSHPKKASATITVTSSTGESATFEPRGTNECYDKGWLFFRLRDGSAATLIGPGPFTYTVDLVLDGKHYTGTGRYPDDIQKDNEPNVTLNWDPPLPSYTID
ncbi:MAG: hypothetical protein HZY75_01985 [Nocardioidaceae bacterium]|nr:MAG: hypothetical protein HZY75_01985 [Nocardioidaceae bacterium]